MDKQANKRTNKLMSKLMNKQTNEQTNGTTHESRKLYLALISEWKKPQYPNWLE